MITDQEFRDLHPAEEGWLELTPGVFTIRRMGTAAPTSAERDADRRNRAAAAQRGSAGIASLSDRRPLVELCSRVAETEDQGAEVYSVLVRQPDAARASLTALLEAHHGDGGPRAVRRAVSDYARLPSPHRGALAELALILEGPHRRDRRSRRR